MLSGVKAAVSISVLSSSRASASIARFFSALYRLNKPSVRLFEGCVRPWRFDRSSTARSRFCSGCGIMQNGERRRLIFFDAKMSQPQPSPTFLTPRCQLLEPKNNNQSIQVGLFVGSNVADARDQLGHSARDFFWLKMDSSRQLSLRELPPYVTFSFSNERMSNLPRGVVANLPQTSLLYRLATNPTVASSNAPIRLNISSAVGKRVFDYLRHDLVIPSMSPVSKIADPIWQESLQYLGLPSELDVRMEKLLTLGDAHDNLVRRAFEKEFRRWVLTDSRNRAEWAGKTRFSTFIVNGGPGSILPVSKQDIVDSDGNSKTVLLGKALVSHPDIVRDVAAAMGFLITITEWSAEKKAKIVAMQKGIKEERPMGYGSATAQVLRYYFSPAAQDMFNERKSTGLLPLIPNNTSLVRIVDVEIEGLGKLPI